MSKEIDTWAQNEKGLKSTGKKNNQRMFPREVVKDNFFCLLILLGMYYLSTMVRWIFPNPHKSVCTLSHTLSFQNLRLWPLLSHSPSSSWQPAKGMVRFGLKTCTLLQRNYNGLMWTLSSLLSKFTSSPSSVVHSLYKKYMCICS